MYLWNDIALIEDDAYFTKWVKEAGRLDHHQGFLQYLRPYLKGTVVDAGANIGTHTVFYAKYAREVLAFEPNPVAFECLQHNTKDLKNVTIFPWALGADYGTVSIMPQGDNYGAVYTCPGIDRLRTPLDHFDSFDVDFIKIDVEGDEIDVLKGASKLIAHNQPVMCIECNQSTLERKGLTQLDLLDYIKALNYSTNYRKPDISCDLLCTPQSF